MRSVNRLAVVSASLLVMALSACGTTAPQSPAAQGTADPTAAGSSSSVQPADLKLVFPTAAAAPNEQVGSYAVALEMGYFKDENLNVTVNNSDGSTAAIQAVASGSADVGFASALNLIPSIEKGVPVIAFGGLVQNWPYQIAVPPNSDIKTPQDLKGATIGIISLASASNGYTRSVLTLAGLDPDKDAKLTPVGAGAAAAAAMDAGKVDALALYGAAYGQLEAAGVELRYLDNDAFFSKLFSLTFFTTNKQLQERPDVFARLGRAMYKATLYTAANPEAAMKIGYKVFPALAPTTDADAQLVKDTDALKMWLESAVPLTGTPSDWSDWGQISDDRWDAIQEFMMKYNGNLKAKLPVEKLWNGSLVDSMNDFDSAAVIAKAKSS